MKAIKKLLAIVLTVCMLIGMPLSIDVAATGNPSATDFNLVSAMIIPDSWGTGLDGDKQLSLYFTGGPISIDTTAVKAFVGIGNAATTSGWYDGEQRTSIAGIYFTGTLSQSDAMLGGTAKAGHKNPNNWIFTIDGAKTSWDLSALAAPLRAYFDSPIDTLPEMMKLANLTQSDLKFSIGEVTGTNGDGVIDGVVESSSSTKLKARCADLNMTDGNRGGKDANAGDGAWCKVYDEDSAPQLAGVYLNESAKTLKIMSTHNMYYDYRGNWHVYVSIRVLNNRGMIYCYTEENGFVAYKDTDASVRDSQLLSIGLKLETPAGIVANHSKINTFQLSDDQYNKVMNWRELVAAHNATAAEADQLAVSLVIEEQNDTTARLPEGRGDGHQNHYFEAIWTTIPGGNEQGVPFMPTYTDMGGWVADCLAAEITTADELEAKAADNITITKVTTVEREGHSDRVVLTFSEPIGDSLNKSGHQGSDPTKNNRETGLQPYIRVYDSTGKLMTHDPGTKTLTTTDSNHLQWAVTGWIPDNADGSAWLGTVNARWGCDTYDEIVAYCASLTDANGKAVTAANGYQIQLSIQDAANANGYTKISGNALVDGIRSLDGTKRLYANNRQSDTEERATCNFSESLQITAVNIYNDNLVVITFDRPIDIDKAVTAINTTKIPTVWISGAEEIMNGNNPICPNRDEKNHIQSQIGNAQQFGNANNKLLLTGGNWPDLLAKIDTYNAKYGVNAYPILHIQGGPSDGIIPGFVGTDGTVLYNSCPKTGATWAGRYMTPVSNASNDVKIEQITGDCEKNALIVEFSEPIKYSKVTAEKTAGGTTTRTEVYISRYSNIDGALNLDHDGAPNTKKLADGGSPNYQQPTTGFSASDANGNEINNEYSKYWVFYFAEGAVEGAVGYNAPGNPNYDPTIGYGFAVYEVASGDLTDAYKLADANYLEDFATAPDANGKSRYLRCNSVTWGHRYFKAPTVGDAVVGESAVMLSDRVVQITFSAPVLVGAGYNAIRVTPGDNNLIDNWNADYQLGGSVKAVNPDANGYSTVWNFTAGQSIIDWADSHFFNDEKYKDVANRDLMMSFESNTVDYKTNFGHKANGTVERIISVDGIPVAASEWHRGNDGLYLSIKDDPAFDEGAVALYNGASYTSVEAAVEAAKTNGGTVTMIRDDVFTGQNGISVAASVVLDLAGKTLDLGTGSLVGNGHVIDSTNGNGLVKIEYLAENQMANFATDNPQLPLYDSAKTGYRLFNTEVIAVGTKEATTDSCKYGFKVTFTNSAAYALLKDVDYNDTTVAFELDTARLDEAHRSCPLVDAKLADYAQKMIDTPDTNWVITLKITGLEKLNDDPLTVAGKITSAGTEMRVTIPVTNA